MNLEAAGVDCDNTGVRVDDFLQTSNPRIYAAGDACMEHKFTHTADASARIVVRNALFLGRERMSSLTIPWCTYTDPEIAHVGLYALQAREREIPVKTFTIPMHDVDRAIADDEEAGFVKIHVKERTDRILGATRSPWRWSRGSVWVRLRASSTPIRPRPKRSRRRRTPTTARV
jgi:pyruvate/2-oxoglutarate dehydrogenase complex dihydrolipoamide dehydrogenase (E3) component